MAHEFSGGALPTSTPMTGSTRSSAACSSAALTTPCSTTTFSIAARPLGRLPRALLLLLPPLLPARPLLSPTILHGEG